MENIRKREDHQSICPSRSNDRLQQDNLVDAEESLNEFRVDKEKLNDLAYMFHDSDKEWQE